MRGVAGSLLILGVSACSQDADGPAIDPEDLIECALDSTAFERECAIEQRRVDNVLTMVVRHPDGGFRRFEVLTDGRGVATADGADVAQVQLAEGGIEVTVGQDRYRLPATELNDDGR